MQVGDLVHNPRYPYWGMGVVLEVNEIAVHVHWFNAEPEWHVKESLEKL